MVYLVLVWLNITPINSKAYSLQFANYFKDYIKMLLSITDLQYYYRTVVGRWLYWLLLNIYSIKVNECLYIYLCFIMCSNLHKL